MRCPIFPFHSIFTFLDFIDKQQVLNVFHQWCLMLPYHCKNSCNVRFPSFLSKPWYIYMSVMIIQLRPITHIDFSYVINTVRLWNAVATFTIVSAMDMIWQKRAINENIKFLLSFLLTLCLYNLFWWRLNIYLEGKYMFLQMNFVL